MTADTPPTDERLAELLRVTDRADMEDVAGSAVAALCREVLRLRAKQGLSLCWCEHCGWTAGPMPHEDASLIIAMHQRTCEKHPIAAVRAERNRLAVDNASLSAQLTAARGLLEKCQIELMQRPMEYPSNRQLIAELVAFLTVGGTGGPKS